MKFKLRKFRKGDEESLQRNINDAGIARYTFDIPYPYSRNDAIAWIRKNLRFQKSRKPEKINFVIDINGEVAGSVGLSDINRKNRRAELGYWLARKYWNKGIMTKATSFATRFGFKKLKLARIYAFVFIPNKASQKVLEKNGFRLEGRLKKVIIKNGKFYDNLLYAKVK